MMVKINPGTPEGTITAPPSKSIMQRTCAGALLHNGTTLINNPGKAADDQAAVNIISTLGAEIQKQSPDQMLIRSSGEIQTASCINCGESGLSARLFTPIAALSGHRIRINGTGSLRQRPMQAFGDILRKISVQLPDFSGNIPFTVKGPLQPADIALDGSISSQFLTGLLFAFAAAATSSVSITVSDLKSKPYIDLTLQTLATFGYKVRNENYQRFLIDPFTFRYQRHITVDVHGDWSSAAYWLTSAAIKGKVSVINLPLETTQADRKILEILHQTGSRIKIGNNAVIVEKNDLHSFETDLTDCPDLFPVIAVLAACCNGESSLKGLHRLQHKESDRQKSIAGLLETFGVRYKTENDRLAIEGKTILDAGLVKGYNDHRIVMAATVAALNANGPTLITDAGAVGKSYPDFFRDLASLGIPYEQIH